MKKIVVAILCLIPFAHALETKINPKQILSNQVLSLSSNYSFKARIFVQPVRTNFSAFIGTNAVSEELLGLYLDNHSDPITRKLNNNYKGKVVGSFVFLGFGYGFIFTGAGILGAGIASQNTTLNTAGLITVLASLPFTLISLFISAEALKDRINAIQKNNEVIPTSQLIGFNDLKQNLFEFALKF